MRIKKHHKLLKYMYLSYCKIFKSNGCKFEIGEDYDLNFLFEKSRIYFFHNGNKTIRMIYDQTIKGTDENPRDELSNQNSTSNKPDIVIMVYENNLIQNCIILEVKYERKITFIAKQVRHQYLYN